MTQIPPGKNLVLVNLPKEWQPLFEKLSRNTGRCESAVQWLYSECHDARKRAGFPTNLPPDWRVLAEYLCSTSPTIDGDRLTWKQRLHLIPKPTLVLFARLLVRLCRQIPVSAVEQFAASLVELLDDTDDTEVAFHEDIQVAIASLKSCYNTSTPEPMDTASAAVVTETAEVPTVVHDEICASVPVVISSGGGEDQGMANGRELDHRDSTEQHEDSMLLSSQATIGSVLASGGPGGMRHRTAHRDVDGHPCLAALPTPVKLGLSRLQDDFLAANEKSEFSDLDVLASLSLEQVEAFVSALPLEDLSESALGAVSKQLSTMSSALSVSVSEYVCHQLISHQIVTLTQLASRSLYSAIVLLISRYPHAVLAAVLVPILTDPAQAGTFQCELVRRMIREVLSPEQCAALAAGFLQGSSAATSAQPWTEEQIAVIQSLTEVKIQLEVDACTALVICLANQATSQAKNLKFAKFFLAVLQHQGAQLSSQLSSLQIAAEANGTFLKKPLLAALRKLQ